MSQESQQGLGIWMLIALVAGNMLGSGGLLLPASLASIGSIGILAWIATAIGALFLALTFANLSRIDPREGGPYVYCHDAFGEFASFQVAYCYWMAIWIGNAAIVVACIGYLAVFFPRLACDQQLAFWVGAATVWLFTFINTLGVRQVGIVQLITSILKIVPLVITAFIAIFFIDPSHYHIFNVSGQSNHVAFNNAAALTLWSFIGVESATIPTGVIINPERNIPLATLIGTVVAAFVYILGTIAIMGIIPMAELANLSAPYAEVAKIIFGGWAYWLMDAVAVIACLGTLNGWILLQAHVPLAMAQDKLFPQVFAQQNKDGTPVYGVILTSVLVTILLAMSSSKHFVEQFNMIILLAVLATLILYLYSSMAALIIFLKHKQKLTAGKLIRNILTAIIAFVYSFWAVIGAGTEIVFYGTVLFLTSVPIYIWVKWRELSNV